MRKHSFGVSLVEVLVSILVLSIGLLGTAGLMSASVRSTNTAFFTSQATFLADDIIDRMRANVVAARAGSYNVNAGANCGAAAGSMAAVDCAEWKTALSDSLPGGDGSVNVNGNAVTVVIQWDQGANSFTTTSQL